MTTFSVEIHEDIVTRLKRSAQPEITLDLPSVPEPGDKLWVKSMRGTNIVETEKCIILESCRVSRLRPTVRLVLLFGIATNHGHDASCEQEALCERRQHAPLPDRSIRSKQSQEELLQSLNQVARKLALLNKKNTVTSERAGHTSSTVTNDCAADGVEDSDSVGRDKE
ncbi:Uncharacterised protein [Klebsiella pneumoniae]|uniref:hypothetical protein n=1 Tax=Klebsiella pneumoniae TaxID=573 RepID=UPI000E079760|nr:hypothetical protein [Klebsiella pneumoniae]MCD5719506.1 hypothetical protein [Klebsiella pneumoniae]MCP5599678.1 hypothetical protein [Klebsiella pneumoniae]STV89620.1 Uncharacterised protein [Klebsiella pneumoniae]